MVKSVYIHIPFCKSKCHYCSFVSFNKLELKKEYLKALGQEIKQSYQGELLNTIYFGGGTPSLLTVQEFENLLRYFNINEINNNTKLIDNVYVSLQNIFEWPSNANSNSDGYCLGGNSHIGILSDGSVIICCLDGEGESNLGNIFYEDLSFILNSEKYHNIINYFKNNKCYLDICKKCTYKNRFK